MDVELTNPCDDPTLLETGERERPVLREPEAHDSGEDSALPPHDDRQVEARAAGPVDLAFRSEVHCRALLPGEA